MVIKNTTKDERHVANLQLVKETNILLIFNLIYIYGPISRAEIAQRTKLSPTTVSSLAAELIKNGTVMETGTGETTTSGRKPIMLEINPNGGYVVAIEMIDRGLICSLFDLNCCEMKSVFIDVPDYGNIGQHIVASVRKIIHESKIGEQKLLGICIGVPGLLDVSNNRVITSTVLPINDENDFYHSIKENFKNIPILMGNESSFCAYAYAHKEIENYKNPQNLVFIDVNTGIGAGILINGEIYTGSFGLASEIGHMSIDMNGPVCKCGNKGCLEVMASVPAICRSTIFTIMSGQETIIMDIIDGDLNKVNIDVIRKAIDTEDKLALKVSDDTALRLAFGINNIINMLNPDTVVLGGEITRLGTKFLEMVNKNLNNIMLKPNKGKINVQFSKLSGNTATLGAAKYLLDDIFKSRGLVL